ncbi:MAG: BlaI/MecI/CopY family transcriptional regulator [Erysipelotrichales bacterium]|nr:BlaI/MecI/CopY family transcriptional regulator [Erysipelotrichales bacterium]
MNRLSEAELKVMKMLWKHTELTSREVFELLYDDTQWSIKTVRTMLKRLADKDIVSINSHKEELTYSSLMNEDEYIKFTKEKIADDLFSGSTLDLLLSFVKQGITKEEAEMLKKELSKYE